MLPTSSSLLREETPSAPFGRQALLTLVRLGVGIGLLGYLDKSGLIGFRALERLLTAWPLTLAAVALILVDVALMGLRLSYLFRPHGLRMPVGTALRLTLVSFFFGTFLPGAAGGDLAKLFYATRETSGRKAEVATIVIFDRAVGLFSLLILPLFFAPLFPQLIAGVPLLRLLLISSAAFASAMMAAFLACLLHESVVRRIANRIGIRPLRELVARVLQTIGSYRRSPVTLLSALGISLLANLSIIAVTALAVLAVNPAGVSARMCLIIPIGHIANSLPLTPGGLGVGETAFDTLFRLARLSGGAEALLCWRIWTALVSVGGLFFYLRGVDRCVFEADPPEVAEKVEPGEPEVVPRPTAPAL